MKVVPTGQKPPMIADTGAQSQSQQAARAKAVAMLSGTPAPTNQNAVAPEERQSVTMQTRMPEVQEIPQEVSQSHTPETVEDTGAPAAKPQEPTHSAQLARLIKREQALRAQAAKQEAAFKAREEAIKAREAEMSGKNASPAPDLSEYIPRQRLKEATFETLAEAGVDVNTIAEQMLQYQQTPVDPRINAQIHKMQETIQRLEDANEEARKAAETAQSEQYQAAVKQIRQDAQALVASDDTYETIRNTKSVSDVVELIEKTFQEEGRVMSVEEAAQEVEEYLLDQLTNYAKSIKKVQQRLAPKAPEPKVEPGSQGQPRQQSQAPKTLTNDMPVSRQRMSARDRAVAVAEGRLDPSSRR